MRGYHSSVLLNETIEALKVRDAWYLDCTLGDGGHSIEIIRRGGKVVGIDVDPQALERVRERFRAEGISEDKFRLILGNFRDIKNLLQPVSPTGGRGEQTEMRDQGFAGAKSSLAGAIFDLGVSSLQLETPQRGFSFGKEGPLDMRMDPTLQVTALDLLNTLGRKELYELFKKMGEEKYSKRLADALVRSREVKPFTTTTELAKVVVRAVGGFRGLPTVRRIHPATRVFQALRIVVNDELHALEEGLDEVKDLIEKDGRIVVISFHSLEDRIVKNAFKRWKLEGEGKILTKKPVVPAEMEVESNPRARSAKMRVFEKL